MVYLVFAIDAILLIMAVWNGYLSGKYAQLLLQRIDQNYHSQMSKFKVWRNPLKNEGNPYLSFSYLQMLRFLKSKEDFDDPQIKEFKKKVLRGHNRALISILVMWAFSALWFFGSLLLKRITEQ